MFLNHNFRYGLPQAGEFWELNSTYFKVAVVGNTDLDYSVCKSYSTHLGAVVAETVVVVGEQDDISCPGEEILTLATDFSDLVQVNWEVLFPVRTELAVFKRCSADSDTRSNDFSSLDMDKSSLPHSLLSSITIIFLGISLNWYTSLCPSTFARIPLW